MDRYGARAFTGDVNSGILNGNHLLLFMGMQKYLSKIAVVVFLVAIIGAGVTFPVAPVAPLFSVQSAHAIPVFVIGDLVQLMLWAKDQLIMTLRDAAVRKINTMMRDSVLSSVLGSGNPLFVTNWKTTLNQPIESTFNSINNQLSSLGSSIPGVVMSQLNLAQFAQSIDSNYDSSSISQLFKNIQQNPQIAQEGAEELLNSGGLAAYEKAFSPDYDPLWLSLQVHDQMIAQTDNNVQAVKDEAVSSGGFLGKKDSNGTIQTPGSMINQVVSQSVVKADFDFSSNVQSILSAIINAMVSAVIDQGLSGLSSNANGSYTGVTYTTGGTSTSSATSTNGGDLQDQFGSAISAARNDYTKFLAYANAPLISSSTDSIPQNVITWALQTAQGLNATCPTAVFSFRESDNWVDKTTIRGITQTLTQFSIDWPMLTASATQGLADIAALDYTSPTALTQIQNIVANDGQFVANTTYQQTKSFPRFIPHVKADLDAFTCPATTPYE